MISTKQHHNAWAVVETGCATIHGRKTHSIITHRCSRFLKEHAMMQKINFGRHFKEDITALVAAGFLWLLFVALSTGG